MKRFVILDKQVGQTPLECAEAWRAEQTDEYQSAPLAYAGRLDPMASGKLLVLIGEECKRQEDYHNLDKEYEFTVLLGAHSDSGDVLGLITPGPVIPPPDTAKIKNVCRGLTGTITLPYPIFSAKPVKGKPLHTWAVESRLDEIEIPTKTSTVYSLTYLKSENIIIDELYATVIEKINLIPKVTDERKALGNDFRRDDVRASWKAFQEARTSDSYLLLTFRCRASSGTYMRSLAEIIGTKLGTTGLAYTIVRTKIGRYHKLPLGLSIWHPRYF